MRPVNDLQSPVSSTALVAAAEIRASRKINSASSLHTAMGGDAHAETRSGKDRRKSAVCHTGTVKSVPFRYSPDAPRLDAAFVAQLLGQMMPDCTVGSAGTLAAYAETPSSAQVFDAQM